jgi:hypothetical protein
MAGEQIPIPAPEVAARPEQPQARQVEGPQVPPGDIADPMRLSGRRVVFRGIVRQLTDEELRNPGVQKLLLDNLETAETRCAELSAYADRYYDADKRVAVLLEKLNLDRTTEVAFGVGVGLGSAIMGLSPLFWKTQPGGALVLVLGTLLVAGGIAARVVRR